MATKTVEIEGELRQVSEYGVLIGETIICYVDGDLVAYENGKQIYTYNFDGHAAEILETLYHEPTLVTPVLWDASLETHTQDIEENDG